ncbi:deoxyguanosinetriphosphate triphosphohydrolase [Deltaproteobacteria bacterium PRO3]|nr:deoxyguanosinetriphosphate triphosphohydrolase [Deltaproteobacteria bacterium PRO3]
MSLQTRQELEAWEEKTLATYASHCARSMGREYPQDEHPYRTRFQRDRDRIVHSKAFRRLEYKTQVFVNHEGDHYRTRLTHSLEVAQISRSIARMLRLNEDLAEGICLAHDLGHPPFGHSGQDVMNDLMKDKGGFEHNRQSLRIVTVLEDRYPRFPGLNLSFEVLEGISKHFTDYDLPDGRGFHREGQPSLEAQIANLSDEIAYNNHDLDDGLRSGMITLAQLREVEIWQELFERVEAELPEARLKVKVHETIRRLINRLVTDLVEHTMAGIENLKIQTVEDVRRAPRQLVGYSEQLRGKNAELKKFLFKNLYRHYRVERMADKAERILRDLFRAYTHNPKILPPWVFERAGSDDPMRAICDYVAGMTDRFALDEHQKLYDPHARV